MREPSESQPTIWIISFYKFQTLQPDTLTDVCKSMEQMHRLYGLRGLCILGEEGINCTLSMAPVHAATVKQGLSILFGPEWSLFKESAASAHPFCEFKIRIKKEIVTAGRPDLQPANSFYRHLTPDEWHQAIKEQDSIVIDTRNSYEYDIGRFQGALNPNTREFTQFSKWLESANLPKDKKILIYCTGGIRCEKAILQMEEQGYNNVYQLDGGILNYLQKRPNQAFDGECFVFDERVAVDQFLAPTKTYKLCPHCGQPAKEKIDCMHCGQEALVCAKCLADANQFRTCSKNCAHHFQLTLTESAPRVASEWRT